MSQTFDGTIASIILLPMEANFALLLPLWGVPKNSTAYVETNIECRCCMSLLVLLAEYARACAELPRVERVSDHFLTLLTIIPPKE